MELLQLWRTKTILVDGEPIKVYSVDAGKTWVSKPSDMMQFKQRRAEIKAGLQQSIELCDLPEISSYTQKVSWQEFFQR